MLEKAFGHRNYRLPQSHFESKPEFDLEIEEQFIDLSSDRQLALVLKMFMKLDLNDKASSHYPFSAKFTIAVFEQDTNDLKKIRTLSQNFSPELINTPDVREAMLSAMKEFRGPLIAGLSTNSEWLTAASVSLDKKFAELLGQSFTNANAVAKRDSARPAL